ncbi:hypothetical protein TorRG33x02_100540 [Trema orientale]|uniref:Uncharacterized protein n=1 Tax=Trema orientale TaxID=63057 RepID=A0A2P5F891_TREOI|nr:hypothetical protein TorRG33x02_100540 [Trema orientale]
MTPLLDFSIATDWYSGTPWYSSRELLPALVRFLNLGRNALNASSRGQNTVRPPARLSSKVPTASASASRVSAKTLHPWADMIPVMLISAGAGVGAEAAADGRTWLIWMTEML